MRTHTNTDMCTHESVVLCLKFSQSTIGGKAVFQIFDKKLLITCSYYQYVLIIKNIQGNRTPDYDICTRKKGRNIKKQTNVGSK